MTPTVKQLEIFGIGQITLENGDTHDVHVITRETIDGEHNELAYVFDFPDAAHIVHCVNTHEALVEAAQAVIDGLKFYKEDLSTYVTAIGDLEHALTLARKEQP